MSYTAFLTYLVIFLAGFTVGYVCHIVKTNRWIIKHDVRPEDFFKKNSKKK